MRIEAGIAIVGDPGFVSSDDTAPIATTYTNAVSQLVKRDLT